LKPGMNDRLNGEFTTKFRGSDFEELFYLHRNMSKTILDYILRNYFVAEGFDPIEKEVRYAGRPSTEIELSVTASSATAIRQYGNDMIIGIIPLDIPGFEKPVNRSMDVQINAPVIRSDTLVYDIPSGCDVTSIPSDTTVTNAYGRYELYADETDNAVRVVKSVRINSGIIPLRDYPSFYMFINTIRSMEHNNNIILTKP